jgi:hypothetical protein
MGMPHVPLRLPVSFRASSERILGDLILERLERIMPETETTVAIRYLEDASLLLSLYRSFQGIAASVCRELIPLFDSALRGPLSKEETNNLEGMLEMEKQSAITSSRVESKAQRVKGAYHLSKAVAMRRK